MVKLKQPNRPQTGVRTTLQDNCTGLEHLHYFGHDLKGHNLVTTSLKKSFSSG